jgi:hypothetical protein
MLDTKPRDDDPPRVVVEGFIDDIADIVRARDSHLPFRRLTALERACVMRWDEEVEQRERAHKARVDKLFELIAAVVMRDQ